MAGFSSPDLPAYLCYAVVLFVGVVVARSSVNDLLAAYPDHWAFVGTWSLFAAYVVLPIALFWFLDYTGTLRDTSLFAAVVIAVGYRQIFAGGVQGITMPGQTPALWKPFEAWVNRVADRIATRNKQYRDRFDERVRSLILADTQKLTHFEQLALEKSKDSTSLSASLAPYKGPAPQAGANARMLDILWRDLRTSEPDQYGYLLYKRRLVSWWQYWRWFEKGRSKLISASVALVVVAVLIGTYSWARLNTEHGIGQWEKASTTYHQWRFLKPNASERDRWRSREYLAREIQAAADRARQTAQAPKDATPGEDVSVSKLAPGGRRLQKILLPLIVELRYPDITPRQADDITRLLVDCHGMVVDAVHLPELIESLRTQNDSVRLLIHRTLLALQQADYPGATPDESLSAWVPAKDETPGDIDMRVRAWHRWWHAANADPS
jgi:hypothetical protein